MLFLFRKESQTLCFSECIPIGEMWWDLRYRLHKGSPRISHPPSWSQSFSRGRISHDVLYMMLCQYILASIGDAWEPFPNLGFSNFVQSICEFVRLKVSPKVLICRLDFFFFHFVFISVFVFSLTLLCPFVLQGADVTDPGTETEESLGASDSTQRPADSQTPSRKIQEKPVKPIAHM